MRNTRNRLLESVFAIDMAQSKAGSDVAVTHTISKLTGLHCIHAAAAIKTSTAIIQ